MAASPTLRVMGPRWSMLLDNTMTPCLETRQNVGFGPTMPHRAAGWRIDMAVSLPMAAKARPAATAAAEPPDEPPVM